MTTDDNADGNKLTRPSSERRHKRENDNIDSAEEEYEGRNMMLILGTETERERGLFPNSYFSSYLH